jgi:hypothetical protein
MIKKEIIVSTYITCDRIWLAPPPEEALDVPDRLRVAKVGPALQPQLCQILRCRNVHVRIISCMHSPIQFI